MFDATPPGDAGGAIDAADCEGSSSVTGQVTMTDTTVSGNTGGSFAVDDVATAAP